MSEAASALAATIPGPMGRAEGSALAMGQAQASVGARHGRVCGRRRSAQAMGSGQALRSSGDASALVHGSEQVAGSARVMRWILSGGRGRGAATAGASRVVVGLVRAMGSPQANESVRSIGATAGSRNSIADSGHVVAATPEAEQARPAERLAAPASNTNVATLATRSGARARDCRAPHNGSGVGSRRVNARGGT